MFTFGGWLCIHGFGEEGVGWPSIFYIFGTCLFWQYLEIKKKTKNVYL
jgi:predicted permease